MYVSSTCQHRPTLPARRLRRPSAISGASLASQIPHRLVGEHDAPDQEHLRQITQAQLVAQPPENDQEHDVGRHLGAVEPRAGPLIEPPPALPAPKTSEAMNRLPLPLDGRRRVAVRAVHGGFLDLSKRDLGTYPSTPLPASCPES